MQRSRKRLAVLISVVPLLLLASALLYMVGMQVLEGESRHFWEALEFVGETISSTGYGSENHWTHPLMVIFVVSLQFAGLFLFFLVFPVYLIPFLEERFESRLPTAARDVADHVVIFNFDPAVETVLEELERAGVSTLVVEEDEATARRLTERGHEVVFGALDGGVLDRVRLLQARALVANGTDDQNALLTVSARRMGFEREILALVEEPLHRKPIMLAGATAAYTPRHILGAALAAHASERLSPMVAGFQHLGRKLQISESKITRQSGLVGKTLAEVDLSRRTGVIVIGQWIGGRLVAPPTPDMVLEAGGILVLVGSHENIANFQQLYTGTRVLRKHGPILIAGYGEVGGKVAQLLTDAGEEVQIVDRVATSDEVDIVGNFLDSVVLDAIDFDQLQAVVLALDTDTAALFATVVLKDMAPDVPVIVRVNRAENVEKIYAADADFALSISQVSGQLLARRLLGEEAIELDPLLKVMKVSADELPARRASELEIRERTGCSVVAVERADDLIIELDPDFSFDAGDVIYICGSTVAIQKFNEIFRQA